MRDLPVNKVVVVPEVTDEILKLLPYLNRTVIAILVLRRQDAGRVDCRLTIHLERFDIPQAKKRTGECSSIYLLSWRKTRMQTVMDQEDGGV